jgi:hypothetical protein
VINFKIRTAFTFVVIALLIAGIIFVAWHTVLFYNRVINGAMELKAGHIVVSIIYVFGVFLSAWIVFAISRAWWEEYRGRHGGRRNFPLR